MSAGYRVRVPLGQYSGPGHYWRVVVRVTPDAGEPVYLADHSTLRPIPQTDISGEISGGFQVGDGHYSAALVLTDDLGRACSREWQFEARLDRLAPGLSSTLAPGAVEELSWTPPPAARAPVFGRLTVMVDFADMHWREELPLLLDQAPARRVRLVVFYLARFRLVLFRDDDFHVSDLNRAANETVHEAIKEADKERVVSVQTLQHPAAPSPTADADLLADLVGQELRSGEPSDAVIILGSWFSPGLLPRAARDALAALAAGRAGISQRYFYIRYFPPKLTAGVTSWLPCVQRNSVEYTRAGAMDNPVNPDPASEIFCPAAVSGPAAPPPPGLIGSVVALMKGKTLTVRSWPGFAKAIRTIVDATPTTRPHP
jgi:hypothetical protein